MKRKSMVAVVALCSALLIGYVSYGVNHLVSKDVKMRHNEVQLELKSTEAEKLKVDIKALNGTLQQELQKNEVDQKTQEELNRKIQELEQRNKELEISKANREAEKQRIANAVNKFTGTGTASAASISGTKQDWMRAAGIPESEWWAVDSIVSRESGWNPNAVNKQSGACGLGQQLPCGKWAGAWNDPVAALKGQYGYVVARYGGYAQAVAFWNANHWY
jgi:TolA-binding protein